VKTLLMTDDYTRISAAKARLCHASPFARQDGGTEQELRIAVSIEILDRKRKKGRS